MMLFFGISVLILLFCFLAIGLFALSILAKSLSVRTVPFVPVPNLTLEAIVKALNLKSTSVLYDLGSGDGKVLFACAEMQTFSEVGPCHTRYIGIEYHFLPHILAKMKLKRFTNTYPDRAAQMTLIHGSMFNYSVHAATHIFTYLLPSMMDQLLPKLEKELQKGTRLVSCDFQFSEKKPIEIIDLLYRTKRDRGKKLFVYEF
jgi:hypothetical protein